MKGIYSKVREKKGTIRKQSQWASEIGRERGRERRQLPCLPPAQQWDAETDSVFQSHRLCRPPPSPALQPCKHASHSISHTPPPGHTHTHTRRVQATHALWLKPHMELLPHIHTTGKEPHVGTRSQKHTNTHRKALTKTPRPDKCFSLLLTHLSKNTPDTSDEKLIVWRARCTHLGEMQPPHPTPPNCIFVHLISASSGQAVPPTSQAGDLAITERLLANKLSFKK